MSRIATDLTAPAHVEKYMRSIERAAYWIGALLFLSGVIHVVILLMGDGTWQGPLSLRKPATFGLSFGLTLVTIAWTSSCVGLRDRTRAILLAIFTFACVLETVLVSLQAWRGVPSHFNMETRFDTLVAQLLAGGGATLVAIILIMTIAAFRSTPAIPPSMRTAVRVGFITLLAAFIVGGVMIARGVTLVFSGNAPAAYATGGLFKPSHAVTMHGILLLPALAWLLMLTGWSEERRLRIVRAASGAYLLIVAAVIVANFAGLL
jgi:hypothetical protein